MRLIFDLFPSQTSSRFRGIGRYTLSLAKAMAAQARTHEMRVLANGLYPDSAAQFRNDFAGLVAPGAYAAYTHPPMDPRHSGDLQREKIASAVIHTGYQATGADAILCASPFEGWGERGLVPQANDGLPGGMKVAVLYDFIPWLFPKQHLDPMPDYKQWYARRLASLAQYDLLLAISETTRNDAIRLLGLPPERVVNISGAADAMFRKLPPQALAATDLRLLGIERPFVLYTGNSDYRKNLTGMLEAFARLPRKVRDAHQLVVNQVGNVELFMMQVAAAGLRSDHVVVTGRITDDELLALYNQCAVFVFPSLYEGFGLPVLEAMGCGAAVIAGDNSSIPEVAGRSDMLFDASSPAAISASLLRALTDDAWRAELRAWGLARAAQFSWDRTAQATWEAIETEWQRRRAAALALPAPSGTPRLRVAALAALDPGVTRERALAWMAALAAHADIEMVDDRAGEENLSRHSLPRHWSRFDTVLYVATADSLTPELVDLIRSAPGVLFLLGASDAVAQPPAADAAAGLPACAAGLTQLLRDQGLQGLLAAHRQGPRRSVAPSPLGRSLLEGLRCLVLEDERLALALRQAYPPAVLPELLVLVNDEEAGAQPDVRSLAAALHRGADKSWRRAPAHIAAALRNTALAACAIDEVARHAESNLRLNRSGRILIDVTGLSSTDGADGVPGTAGIVQSLCLVAESSTPIELIHVHEGRLYRAGTVAAALFGIDNTAYLTGLVDIHPGDVLFMPAAVQEYWPQFLPVFESVRQFGGRVVVVVHELRELEAAMRHSDMLLCASPDLYEGVRTHIAEDANRRSPAPRVAYWAPGAGMARDREDSARQALTLLRTAFER